MKQIIVRENQHITLPLFWHGEKRSESREIHLAARGASISLVGLLLGRGEQAFDLSTKIVHQAPETTSEVIIKGALTDSAKVNFEGLVKIEPGAKGTKTWLAAHILLLSDTAKGRAVPGLEILENDIKAGHATTVGKVSELDLFYLRSRGLSKKAATELIIEGFLKSVITKLPKERQAYANKLIANYYKN